LAIFANCGKLEVELGEIIMPTRNINLTEHYDDFVHNLVSSGRFKNASEVMRAGLHMLEKQTVEDEEKLELLRRLAKEGIDQLDRGEGIVLHGEGELRDYIAKIGRRVANKRKAQSLDE
jgi:antitoxin ParD1/3/4